MATINTINVGGIDKEIEDTFARANITTEAERLEERIDAIIAPPGSAPSAAEVLDARIGANGTVYPSLGSAIRTQVDDLHDALILSSFNEITWYDGKYQNNAGQEVAHELFSVSQYIDIHNYSNLVFITTIMDAAAVCIFDSNYNLVSFYRNSDSTRIPFTQTVPISSKMYYIRLCTRTAEKDLCYVFTNTNPADRLFIEKNNSYNNLPESYRDCDNLPPNTVIPFYFGWNESIASTMLHFPVTSFSGEIITINGVKNNPTVWGFQLAVHHPNNNTQEVYYRTRYTQWSDWKSLVGIKSEDTIIIHGNYSYSTLPEAYRDCNNLPINSFIPYHFGWTPEIAETMRNFPINNFSGSILTMNGNKTNVDFGIQLAYTELPRGNRYFIRSRYADWGEWNEFALKSNAVGNDYQKNLFAAFDVVGVIGDSLASGECYTPSGDHEDMYLYSWLQFMCREVGITGYNFSRGGMTTKDWLTDGRGYPMASQTDKLCRAYFIGLGQNDANRSYTIGSISDINDSDYTLNADTFYGSYGGIIQRMKTLVPDAKFFLITDPLGASSSTREAYNIAIRNICHHFTNCYLIDLSDDYSDIFLSPSGFIQANNTSNHYSAAAYKYMASILGDIVDSIILNNPSEFKYIQFIEI